MKLIKQLYSSQTIKRKAPVNLKQGDSNFFGGEPFEYTLPASSFNYIGKASVTSQGIIMKHFLPLKRFIVCYDIDFKHYFFRYILHVLSKYKRHKPGGKQKYLIIFDNYSGPKGFYHWISDGLTRLVEMNEQLNEFVVLIPEYFKHEQLYMDTLALFNIKQIYYIPEKTYVKIDHLYVMDFIAPTGNFNPHNFLKLQKLVWDAYNLKKSEANEYIYISREKASRRFVLNEPEVIWLLQSYDFKIVCLEDYKFEEQVKLIFKTKYLVSIHGAALTHISFMQKGSKVLEFKRLNDSSNFVYFSLADVAGVDYYYQFCDVKEKSKNANNFDLTVNIEELDATIKLMLTTR